MTPTHPLLAAIRDGALIVDAQGRIVAANENAGRLLGCAADRLAGTQLGEIPEAVALRLTAALDQCLREGSFHEETGHGRGDPERRHLELSAATFHPADGARHVCLLLHDLSELQRTQDRLHAAQERLIVHLDHSPLAIIEWGGPRFEILRWSGTAEETFGWTAEEAVGRTIDELPWIYEEDRGSVSRIMEEMLSGRSLRNVNRNRNRRKDGRIIHCEWYNTAMLDAAGRLESVLSQVVDVTERNQTREDLAHTAELLSRSQELAHVGSWEVELADGRLAWSDEVYRIFGVAKNEFRHTLAGFFELVHPADRAIVDNAFQAALRANREWYEVEHRIIRPRTGEVRHVIEKGRNLRNQAGTIVRAVGMVQDITEHKRAEEDRLIVSKLESTGILAGGLAHDFNNLLTCIVLNIDVAESGLAADEQTRQCLAEARRAVAAAHALTQKLIVFARGGSALPQPTGIDRLIPDAVRTALSGAATRSEIRLAPDLWEAVVDPGQLEQVIQHLVTNAREAMADQGTLAVDAGNVRLGPQEVPHLAAGEYVQIRVTDHGHGIPPENLTRIFDPYFSTKEKGPQKGMGLGLTICHAVVQRLGGAMAVESEPQVATTFTVFLPAARTTPVAPEPSVAADRASPIAARILVMDDEPTIRTSTLLALRRLGCSVSVAAEGRAAIALHRAAREAGNPFDLVLLDLKVPGGLGGVATFQQMKSEDPSLQAILMSGYGQELADDGIRDLGFAAVISKPFDVPTLRTALARVLARSRG